MAWFPSQKTIQENYENTKCSCPEKWAAWIFSLIFSPGLFTFLIWLSSANMSTACVSLSETFSTGVEMYCKGMIDNIFTTNFNFSKAYHLLALDKFSICLLFHVVNIFNISGAVLIAKQCKYFLLWNLLCTSLLWLTSSPSTASFSF